MAHSSRTLAGALAFTFVASSTLVACNAVPPEPTDVAGPTAAAGPTAVVGVDTCGEPWRPTGSMAQNRMGATGVRLADGTVVVAGGLDPNFVATTSAERYNPATGTWSAAGTLNVTRYYHRAVVLTNGKVLVVGGVTDVGSVTATAELYNPATNTWSLAAPMSTDRYAPQLTLLSDGRVLVSGGIGGGVGTLATAEIYNPSTNAWQLTGTMTSPRSSPGAALLPDGRVLVAGGDNSGYQLTAEIFNPSSGTWSAVSSMSTTRYAPSTAVLQDGRVLVAGGSELLPGAEIFDPASGTWSPTGDMVQPSRFDSDMHRLPDGRVLIAGGTGSAGYLAAAEIFDAATGLWAPVASMSTQRYLAVSVVLLDGRFLIAGGADVNGAVTSTAETYKPCPRPACATPWVATNSMAQERFGATGVRLADDTVLVAGGMGASFSATNTAERYNSTNGTWSATANNMNVARSGHRAVRLLDGRVLVAGGATDSGPTAAVEIYTPAPTNAWSSAASMSTPRNQLHLMVLSDGRVLAFGGQNAVSAALATAEIYDPAGNTWTTTGSMTSARKAAAAAPLSNNRVLVAGGLDGSDAPQSSAEIFTYNPSTHTGTWSAANSMSVTRNAFGAAVLPGGRVLVAGGTESPPGAEIFDPASGSWSPTTNMVQLSRYSSETIPLSDGRVLVAGGTDINGVRSNWTELYDPYIGLWLPLTSMSTPRLRAVSAQLANGRILIAGGFGSAGVTNTAETYMPCPPNLPPVAVCRNVTVPTSPTTCNAAAVNVNNGSYDPDTGPGPLTLSQAPAGPYNLGSSTVTLTASDSILQSTCSATVTVVDNTPPQITCPGQQFLECVNGGASGTFTAPFTDNCGGGTVTCAPSGVFLGLGDHPVTCTAMDGSGNRSSCTFTATVRDTQPPVAGGSKGMVLWPADGLLHEISLMDCANFTVDACYGRLNPLKDYGVITYVTSDEPEDAPGGSDGNTTGDIQVKKPWLALVRAERDSQRDGRVYTLHYLATDPSGNVTPTAGACKVSIPRSSGSTAIDSGSGNGYCFPTAGHPCP